MNLFLQDSSLMRVTSVAWKRFSIKPLRCGFTLVEIMMVVAAIGILVTLGIPTFARARLLSRASAQINDLHVMEEAFQRYSTEKSAFPPIPGNASLPSGMGGYLYGKIWTLKSPAGATYYWSKYSFPTRPNTFIIVLENANPDVMNLVDHDMDDGNPSTGSIRFVSPNYVLILEQ
jgi:prepilin-type N-terminal cleavage/methylation domain-containing protein